MVRATNSGCWCLGGLLGADQRHLLMLEIIMIIIMPISSLAYKIIMEWKILSSLCLHAFSSFVVMAAFASSL
jgi:hypothetical protein